MDAFTIASFGCWIVLAVIAVASISGIFDKISKIAPGEDGSYVLVEDCMARCRYSKTNAAKLIVEKLQLHEEGKNTSREDVRHVLREIGNLYAELTPAEQIAQTREMTFWGTGT